MPRSSPRAVTSRKRHRTAAWRARFMTVRLGPVRSRSPTPSFRSACKGAPNLGGMPRALLVARHFPPIGGAGVHRTVGSVRHLASRGYDVVLVTGPGQQRGRWDFQDPGLLAGIPDGAEIHRVDGPEPAGPGRLLGKLEHLAQRPSEWVRWWVDQAVELGARVGADADVVIASCAPYETAHAGARLAARLGVPWVADLEDPWALDEMRLYPTGLHHRLDRHRMRRALRGAPAIIRPAREAAPRARESFPGRADR